MSELVGLEPRRDRTGLLPRVRSVDDPQAVIDVRRVAQLSIEQPQHLELVDGERCPDEQHIGERVRRGRGRRACGEVAVESRSAEDGDPVRSDPLDLDGVLTALLAPDAQMVGRGPEDGLRRQVVPVVDEREHARACGSCEPHQVGAGRLIGVGGVDDQVVAALLEVAREIAVDGDAPRQDPTCHRVDGFRPEEDRAQQMPPAEQ